MLAPLKSDRTFDNVSGALYAFFDHIESLGADPLKNTISSGKSLNDFAWAIEPQFYPHDNEFLMDPDTVGRNRQERVASRVAAGKSTIYDKVFYFFLPLVDWSAHCSEDDNDCLGAVLSAPLQISRDNVQTMTARILDIYSLVTGDRDDLVASRHPSIKQ